MNAGLRWGLVLVVIATTSAIAEEKPARFEFRPDAKSDELLKTAQVILDGAEPAKAMPLLAELLARGDEPIRMEVMKCLEKRPRLFEGALLREAEKALVEANGKGEDRITQLLAVARKYQPTGVATLAMGEAIVELVRLHRVEEVIGARRALARMEPNEGRWPNRVLDALNSLDCRRKDTTPDEDAPGTRVIWKQPTSGETSVRERLQEHEALLRKAGRPISVGIRPGLALAVVFGGNGAALVWNDYIGLNAFDPVGGNRFWHAPSGLALDGMFKSAFRVGFTTEATQQLRGTTALFDNTRLGHVSVGNGLAYQIEDSPLRLPRPAGKGSLPSVEYWHGDVNRANRLMAWSMATGKLMWLQGEQNKHCDPRLAEGHFLGPPLVLGESLLVLHEQNAALRIVRLDGRTGKVRDIRRLGGLTISLGTDPTASRRAHHLLARDGMVFVPTGCGTLLALDLLTLEVRWRYDHAEPPGTKSGPGISFEPRIGGGLLFSAGPDSRRLHAVDLQSGKVAWTAPLADDDHDFTISHAGDVLVITHAGVRLLDATTGKPRWSLKTGLPAGEGYEGKDETYYQPFVGMGDAPDAVVAIDLKQGKERRRITMPKGLRLGNLIPMGPHVVNVSPYEICVLGSGK